MRNVRMTILVVSVLLSVANIASATTVQGIDIDFVTIGNPGNPGDTRTDYPDSAEPYGCGAVDYVYQIGKYEVTNAQWDAFVSASGAPTGNLSHPPYNAYDKSSHWTGAQQPTNNVSWYEATQFCNYLTSGDKSKGAYQWSGDNANPDDFLGIDRATAEAIYGTIYVLPTEDEWYKAAYYTGSGYSTYANGTDAVPIMGINTNYHDAIGSPWNVGTGTEEQNNTFDIMGNLWEWNEIFGTFSPARGGSFGYDYEWLASSLQRDGIFTVTQSYDFGFRVASVPEPCTLLLLGMGGVLIRNRK